MKTRNATIASVLLIIAGTSMAEEFVTSDVDMVAINRLIRIDTDDSDETERETSSVASEKAIEFFLATIRSPRRTQGCFIALVKQKGKKTWKQLDEATTLEMNQAHLGVDCVLRFRDGFTTPATEILDFAFCDNGILRGGNAIRRVFHRLNLEQKLALLDSGVPFTIPPMDYDFNSTASQLMRNIGYGDVKAIRELPSIKEILNRPFLCYYFRMPFPDDFRYRSPHPDDMEAIAPLAYAVKHGTPPVIKCLLELGADPNTKDEQGTSVLMVSAVWANFEISELLVSKGADIHAANDTGWTPLCYALHSGKNRLALDLLDRGAKFSLLDEYGRNEAFLLDDQPDLLDSLVARGLDISLKKATDGQTPLHVAVVNGFGNLAERLVFHGVDASIKDKDGHTARDIAVADGQFDASAIQRIFGNAKFD